MLGQGRRCSALQARLLFLSARDAELEEALVRLLARSEEKEADRAGESLARAILGLVSEFGVNREQGLGTVRHALGLGEEVLAAAFRQIERGEYYDKVRHEWVEDPNREPYGVKGCVSEWVCFRGAPRQERAHAFSALAARVDSLFFDPGFDFIAAAFLGAFCKEEESPRGDICPFSFSCGLHRDGLAGLRAALKETEESLSAAEKTEETRERLSSVVLLANPFDFSASNRDELLEKVSALDWEGCGIRERMALLCRRKTSCPVAKSQIEMVARAFGAC